MQCAFLNNFINYSETTSCELLSLILSFWYLFFFLMQSPVCPLPPKLHCLRHHWFSHAMLQIV